MNDLQRTLSDTLSDSISDSISDSMSPDLSIIRRILYTDPVWAAYAIADLQPEFARYCSWHVGHSEAGPGLVLIYRGLQPPVCFAIGPAAAVEAALAQVEPLPELYLSIRGEHEPLFAAQFDTRSDRRLMCRMVLRRKEPVEMPHAPGLVRLHTDDLRRVEALYALGGEFAPDAFDPFQLASGVFYGIESADGQLLAAGGTHIVDWDAGVGAIGNMYTQREHRHHGYAGKLLTAIIHDLRAGFVDTIVLNVDQRNLNAARLYERYGFLMHCPYVEGKAVRRSENRKPTEPANAARG